MEIIRGYVLRPKLQRILNRLWDEQSVVPKAVKLFGRTFGTDRGVAQGGSVLPKYFQHCGGCSRKVGTVGSMWATGCISWVGLVNRRAQHSLICGQCPHSRSQTHMGTDNTDGGGNDVLEGGTADKPQEY